MPDYVVQVFFFNPNTPLFLAVQQIDGIAKQREGAAKYLLSPSRYKHCAKQCEAFTCDAGLMMMCLQRTRYVWKVQYTPNPVERKPSEYISVAMGGSESARGSSLAFSKQDRKCRHNP